MPLTDVADSGSEPAVAAWRFEGTVHCRAQPRAGQWRLRGRLAARRGEQAPAEAELLLTGVRPTPPTQQLPATLQGLHVQVQSPTLLSANSGDGRAAPQLLRLQTPEASMSLQVNSVHLQRDASRAFYHAVPGAALPRLTRYGWTLLLTLLRLPLLSRLIDRSYR
jgi:hypothetical protein